MIKAVGGQSTCTWWREIGFASCSPLLLLLLGCPDQQAVAPGKISPQLTAPSLSTTPPAAAAPTHTQLPAQAQTLSAPLPDLRPPPAETSAEAAAHSAKVQQLITQAERTYASGVNNYRAGHLDAAKHDFDAAVDLMLTSGLDLRKDPQLADEFDHLLNAVNSLEIAALKQGGTGFGAPLEAAPLDAADEVTFAANPVLTAKVTSELKSTQSDFPLVVNDYVAGFINYFSNSPSGHAKLLHALENAGKYKDMIATDLREAGVPQDLLYLAVAESSFQPQALNARSGAGGMWQFMPTGAYGLARNGWFDERFDPEKSSKAYARYMKSLYNQFGDWYLAMAAYDWGPGYVQRAVMKTGYADFWELYRRGVLPAETRNYVPGIIAAIIMAKNPGQYGLDKLVPSPPVLSDTVQTNSAVDLRLVADVTGTPLGEIVALNPSLLRPTTPRDMSFDLHIPPGTRDLYSERIKEIPEDKRASWRFHVVRDGESLEEIASTMRAHLSDVTEANALVAGNTVSGGDELVIPLATASPGPRTQHYKSRSGDTLVTVADRFSVSVEDLRRWNHLTSSSLPAGHLLLVAEPMRLAPTGRARSRASHLRGAHGRATRESRSVARSKPQRSVRSTSSHSAGAVATRSTRRTLRPQR